MGAILNSVSQFQGNCEFPHSSMSSVEMAQQVGTRACDSEASAMSLPPRLLVTGSSRTPGHPISPQRKGRWLSTPRPPLSVTVRTRMQGTETCHVIRPFWGIPLLKWVPQEVEMGVLQAPNLLTYFFFLFQFLLLEILVSPATSKSPFFFFFNFYKIFFFSFLAALLPHPSSGLRTLLCLRSWR